MKTDAKKNDGINMPESLARQIRQFELRLRLLETVVAVLGGLCGFLLTYGVLFASDRFWDTPVMLRVALTLGGGTVLGCFAFWWLRHWWWRRRNTRGLARLVQRHYRKMGDRLLGAVELANGNEIPGNASPALCRAAIRQVSEEASKYDFRAAAETKPSKAYILLFIVLLAVVTAAVLSFPKAGWNALLRWTKPFSSVSRYTFVSLEEMPGEQIVPHGEEFEIACRIGARSRWRPTKAICSLSGQPKITARTERGAAVFRIPGQTGIGMLSIRIGDARRRIKIIPTYRPELLGLSSIVILPTYLQRETMTNRIENGSARFLEGSRVSFLGESARRLKSAALLSETDGESGDQPLAVRENRFTSDEFVGSLPTSCDFRWTDYLGLTCPEPYRVSVTTVKDEDPIVECRGMARSIAILEDEIVNLETWAEDDFGLKELWVNWSSVGSSSRGVPELSGTEVIGKGAPDVDNLSGEFTFSPLTAHVPEETLLSLYAYASDYYPGRTPSMSLLYRIYVLSKAQHAKLIQDRMEALQARIDDLAREEEDLLEANRKTTGLSPDKLASDKTTAELKERRFNEESNAEQLEGLSKEAQDLLKEAMRNSGIPESTLAKWSEMAKSMSDLAGNEMKQAAQALRQASTGGQKRKQDLDKAIELEKEILAALRKMEQDLDKSINDMLAMNFINRLRLAAGVEDGIASGIKGLLPNIVGMSVEELGIDEAGELDMFSARQKETSRKVEYIQDDLAGFYNRTKVETFNTIHTEMVEKDAVRKMGDIAGLISKNVGVKAIDQTQQWRDQLNAWADLLQEQSSSSGQGGEGGDGLSQADIEVLIALLRARQREETIRNHTRLLDQDKDTNRRYSADSRKLADKQGLVARDIRPLERKARNKKLRLLVEKVGGEMMNAAMYLRKPRTGSETIAIETEIIELLSACISSCEGQCGGLAQMLMQAMGMQQSMGSGAGGGGGSMAGGTTLDPNKRSTGDMAGEGREDREVEKGGGMDTSLLPEEFRDAMEAYFNALGEEE
ncbi:MAG: hypothetical protein QGH15_00525 [Kiritimatiellia bacterium]|jgi:hypothetical protein|nr:hypothetical protein [Kiritimatiellia bacterium]